MGDALPFSLAGLSFENPQDLTMSLSCHFSPSLLSFWSPDSGVSCGIAFHCRHRQYSEVTDFLRTIRE